MLSAIKNIFTLDILIYTLYYTTQDLYYTQKSLNNKCKTGSHPKSKETRINKIIQHYTSDVDIAIIQCQKKINIRSAIISASLTTEIYMEIPSTRLPLFAKSLRILHNFVDSPDISPRKEFVPILTLQLVVFPSKLFRFLLLQLRFPRVPIFAFTSPRFVPENPMILEAKPYISGYRFVPRTHLCTYTHLVFVSFVHLRAPNNQNSITTTSTCGQERAYFFFFRPEVCRQARARARDE